MWANTFLEHADGFYQAPADSTGKKIAIIGSGPAGLSAAFYLRKAGNDVVVYDDSKEEAGGMLMLRHSGISIAEGIRFAP